MPPLPVRLPQAAQSDRIANQDHHQTAVRVPAPGPPSDRSHRTGRWSIRCSIRRVR